MSKAIFILPLFFSVLYCQTNPNTPIGVIEVCSKLLKDDVRTTRIDPLIKKYKDDSKTLIKAIDSQLADPTVKKELGGTGDAYHACTNDGSDKFNQESIRVFNKCSDRLSNYKLQFVLAIGKDVKNSEVAIEREVAKLVDEGGRAKALASSYAKCNIDRL